MGLFRWLGGKESACNAGATGDTGSIPGSERSPGGGHGNPLLPGESHGQRSLAGYNPWGLKESDTTEQLTLSLAYNINLTKIKFYLI